MNTDSNGNENKGIITLSNGEKIAQIIALLGVTINWEYFSSLPKPIFIFVILIIGFVILGKVFFFVRKEVVKLRNSNQRKFDSTVFEENLKISNERENKQYKVFRPYGGFNWRVLLCSNTKKTCGIEGPYCPEKDCYGKLNDTDTYFGRYEYRCPMPDCGFKKRSDYSVDTLKSNFGKFAEAREIKKEIDRNRQEAKKVREIGQKVRKWFEENPSEKPEENTEEKDQ